MTPTGDFGASFITPHASVILPSLPRSASGEECRDGFSVHRLHNHLPHFYVFQRRPSLPLVAEIKTDYDGSMTAAS